MQGAINVDCCLRKSGIVARYMREPFSNRQEKVVYRQKYLKE